MKPCYACAQERRNSKDYAEGFAMLDLDGGAPWDLLCSLMQAAPRRRLSGSAAAGHPALGGGLGGAVNTVLSRLGDATGKARLLVSLLCLFSRDSAPISASHVVWNVWIRTHAGEKESRWENCWWKRCQGRKVCGLSGAVWRGKEAGGTGRSLQCC
jgi:hypothetical protein